MNYRSMVKKKSHECSWKNLVPNYFTVVLLLLRALHKFYDCIMSMYVSLFYYLLLHIGHRILSDHILLLFIPNY
jgi:hypothetical protein